MTKCDEPGCYNRGYIRQDNISDFILPCKCAQEKRRILIDHQVSRRECDVAGCHEKRVASGFYKATPFSVCAEHDNGTYIPTLDDRDEGYLGLDYNNRPEGLNHNDSKHDSIPPGMGD